MDSTEYPIEGTQEENTQKGSYLITDKYVVATINENDYYYKYQFKDEKLVLTIQYEDEPEILYAKEDNYDLGKIDQMLQGKWDYHKDYENLGERLVFKKGKLDYKVYEPLNDNKVVKHIKGTYKVKDGHVVTSLNNHEENFDYVMKGKELYQ